MLNVSRESSKILVFADQESISLITLYKSQTRKIRDIQTEANSHFKSVQSKTSNAKNTDLYGHREVTSTRVLISDFFPLQCK